MYTNSGSFGKCVVYSPLLYVVLHKRNIIITTTDSTPNVSTNCHATTTSRVRLTNTMSFFLNQSVESEQEQKYVLSNPQNFPGRHYVIDWFSKVRCLSKHRCFPQLPFEQVWPLQKKPFGWVLTNPLNATPLRPGSTFIDGFSIYQKIADFNSYPLGYQFWKSVYKCGAGTQWRSV